MDNIKKAIEYAKTNPDTAFATELRKRIESGAMDAELTSAGIQPPKKQGAIANIIQDVKETGAEIKETFNKGKEAVVAPLEATMDRPTDDTLDSVKALGQSAGAGAGTLSSILGSLLKGGLKVLSPEGVEEGAEAVIQKVAKPIVESETVQNLVNKYNALSEDQKMSVDGLLGVGSLITDFLGLGAGKAVKEVAKPVIKEGLEAIATTVAKTADDAVKTAKEGADAVIKKGVDVTSDVVDKFKPKKTPEQAVGQVTQALPKDANAVGRAITKIDTAGVETYADFAKKIKDSIPDLAKKVDDELLKDTSSYLLKDLALQTESAGGKAVRTNYVQKAIEDLAELYTKVGDNTEAQNIKELLVKATTKGLSKKEVNDLARIYGQEFGEKAFGKTGDALTSVNAQAFENTRSGLKTTARQNLSKDAQILDKQLADIYTLQRYNNKMVDAVAKLKNRVNERGLGEKIGHFVTKYGDILTGGTLRGLVGGLLPRGVGNKVLNALDLEEALKKNLEVINKALDAKDDATLIKAVQDIEKAKGSMFSEATKEVKKPKKKK